MNAELKPLMARFDHVTELTKTRTVMIPGSVRHQWTSWDVGIGNTSNCTGGAAQAPVLRVARPSYLEGPELTIGILANPGYAWEKDIS